MTIEMTTISACQCDSPGWCERHQCEKTAHWFRLCQSRPDYFQMWEEGHGPGQQTTPVQRNPVDKVPCQHQGAALRTETCPSCRGTVRLKIFACGIHGECTIAKRINNEIACCVSCKEYLPDAEMSENDSPTITSITTVGNDP